MSGNWSGALSAFAPLIIGMFVTFIFMCVALMFGIRWMTKDKILCTFHKNHKKGGALLKYDPINACVWLGKEDDPNREKYNVTEDEMEWVEWPGFLPHFFCTTVRSLDYVRGVPMPIHPEKKASTNISAKALRLQSDGNVLQAVYMHARMALGLNKQKPLSTLIMILLVAAVCISLFGAYKSMQTSGDVTTIKGQIQQIGNALGVNTAPIVTPVPSTPYVVTPTTTPTTTPTSNIPGLGGK